MAFRDAVWIQQLGCLVTTIGSAAFMLRHKGRMTTTLPDSNDSRTFAIIGAAMEVHRVLGAGFLEVFYRDALAIEFGLRSIPFAAEVPCNISYKNNSLRGYYRMDFVCFEAVIVEIKARSATGPADHAQVLSYLASTRLECGLLVNFGAPKLEHRRFVLSRARFPATE